MELIDIIGVPYCHHGRDLRGLDCYGCAILAVNILTGKKLNDVYYENHDAQLADRLKPTLNVRQTDEIKAGNLIEITLNSELHIGVIIDKKKYIHATYDRGVRVNDLKTAQIKNIYEVI